MNKREQIKKWFLSEGIKPAYYISPAVCILLGLFAMTSQPKLGLPFLLLGIGLAFYSYNQIQKVKSLATDSQLDNWLEEDIQAIIKDRPYDKLGISKEDLVAESMLVVGPIYWYVNGFDENDILAKNGKDGFNRFTTWTIQLFMFTENYLCSYKCDYNWLKNTYINESTNEFFYKDVVSVKTDTVSSAHTLVDGQRLVHSEAFQLKLMGDEVTVITNDVNLNAKSVMVSRSEKAVQSIRAILRDKKK